MCVCVGPGKRRWRSFLPAAGMLCLSVFFSVCLSLGGWDVKARAAAVSSLPATLLERCLELCMVVAVEGHLLVAEELREDGLCLLGAGLEAGRVAEEVLVLADKTDDGLAHLVLRRQHVLVAHRAVLVEERAEALPHRVLGGAQVALQVDRLEEAAEVRRADGLGERRDRRHGAAERV